MEVGSKTGVIELSRAAFVDVIEEALPLLRQHWEEISAYKDIPLNPNIDRYVELDGAGNLRIFTARVNGKLVGYGVFFLAYNAHYKDSLQAVNDILYVHPDYRNSMVGLRLLRYCEASLREENVQLISYHCKVDHPALQAILNRMGYATVEVNCQKRLDR